MEFIILVVSATILFLFTLPYLYNYYNTDNRPDKPLPVPFEIGDKVLIKETGDIGVVEQKFNPDLYSVNIEGLPLYFNLKELACFSEIRKNKIKNLLS
jgi:hypothetical protein